MVGLEGYMKNQKVRLYTDLSVPNGLLFPFSFILFCLSSFNLLFDVFPLLKFVDNDYKIVVFFQLR